MKGSEFLRKVQRYAKSAGLECGWDPVHGKGSHGTVYVGSGRTILRDLKKELAPGLVRSMCRDLGIDPRQL
jgi:predicted RNA binding protein YcfA (HicA-like mRNA interferase family)